MTIVQRHEAIARMRGLRDVCLEDAYFLAVLGGLLLEDGDSEQALIWLERSLLLDPDSLGAQADFAIALALRGEPEPLRALLSSWRGRVDVPPGLLARMSAVADPAERFVLPAARLGQSPTPARSGSRWELSLLGGHETNLDRSPRLTELTITIPDGPIVLPVDGTPRTGAAWLSGVSWQWAYAPDDHWIWRVGVSGNARASGSEPGTDWRQVQWASSAVYRLGLWRGVAEVGLLEVSGPLGEPFRQVRAGLTGERAVGACRVRLGYEREDRIQGETATLDARYEGAAAAMQCGDSRAGWRAGLTLRGGRDVPRSLDRPGGAQRVRSATLHAGGTLTAGLQVDANWRASDSRDATGYSELLDNGAIRVMRLEQLTVEAALPLATEGLELLLQWQEVRQRSNLALFRYRARAVYSGMRYAW